MKILPVIAIAMFIAFYGCSENTQLQQLTETNSSPSAPQLNIGCPNYLWKNKIDMVKIPKGKFNMFGTQGDQYILVDTESYWIDIREVTVREFQIFLDSNPQYEMPEKLLTAAKTFEGKDRQPAIVRVKDARAYAAWVGKRLPTESEWEKAARGEFGKSRFPWGDEQPTTRYSKNQLIRWLGTHKPFISSGVRVCNEAAIWIKKGRATGIAGDRFIDDEIFANSPHGFGDRFADISSSFFQEVMLYKPNYFGLFDTVGNANEFVADKWNDNSLVLHALGKQSELIPENETDYIHVVKGGGFIHNVAYPEGSPRYSDYTVHVGERSNSMIHQLAGFRLAMDIQTDE